MHLVPDLGIGADAADVFTERVLLAELARCWRSHCPMKGSEYDVLAAEERYETFCSTFLQKLPAVFALQPDKQWDERLPTLAIQRQLLHIAIFESLRWNFRSTLLQTPDQFEHLPRYKKVLIPHNKKALAAAALNLLENVSNLHIMMLGGSHTRYAGVVVPMFEGAVSLLCLCADKDFPGDIVEGRHTIKMDPLALRISNVTRVECMQAARTALSCLQTLQEVAKFAEVGSRTLARLIDSVSSVENSFALDQVYESSDVTTVTQDMGMPSLETLSYDQMRGYGMRGFETDFSFNGIGYTETGPNWEVLPLAVLKEPDFN